MLQFEDIFSCTLHETPPVLLTYAQFADKMKAAYAIYDCIVLAGICQSPRERKEKHMPRPKRCRKVCSMPRVSEFIPRCENAEFIVLTVDEYETIRLIDKQGFSQVESAAYMQVARTTAQQIYNSARKKMASALWMERGFV